MKNQLYKLSLICLAAFLFGCKSSVKLFNQGIAPTELYSDSVVFTRTMRLVFVPVQINGKTYNFLLDTGAPMVVSKELAAELKMKRLARKPVGDSQGASRKLNYFLMPEVTIGSHNFGQLVAIEADLNLDPTLACMKMDGIIGSNLLRHAIWTIDYEENILHFDNKFDAFVPDSAAIVLPFTTKATHTPMVVLMVDSTVIGKVTFDTGSASWLSMPVSRLGVGRLNPDSVHTDIGFLSSGLFGSVADTVYQVRKQLTIGQTSFDSIYVTLEKSKPKSLLGTAFFEDFLVVMNWHTREMYLTPKQKAGARKSFGFSPRYSEGTLRIGSLTHNGQAMQQGIQLNDRLLKINDLDLSEPTRDDYCEVLRLLRENEEITIEVENRGQFTFKKIVL